MAKKKKTKAPQEFSAEPARELLDQAEKLAGWVDAAFQHSADFPPQVVLTVVGDYLVQWTELGPALKKAADGVAGRREELAAKAGALRDQAKEVEALVDELKLRHLIGELAAEDYEARVAEARGGGGDEALSGVEGEIADLEALLADADAITARLDAAEQHRAALEAGGTVEPPASMPEPEPEPEPVPDPSPAAEEPAASELPVDTPVSSPSDEEWDVPPPAAVEPEAATAEPESAAAEPAVEPPPESEAGAELPEWAPLAAPAGGEGDVGATAGEDLMSTGLITAQPGLAAAAAPPPAEPEAAPAPVPSASEGGGEGPRLAVFSPDGKQEMYPFGGEVMSMGRGRNNDIQIKNDGKISRYHCRIFRRGDEFIIEDNKSSNGTLVDSKLVTRQRLDGGEQIQIGETRVIFQL